MKRSIIWLGLFFGSLADSAVFAQRVALATHGKAVVSVVVSDGGSAAQAFAADELAGYLRKISGATFAVVAVAGSGGPAATAGGHAAVADRHAGSTVGSIRLERDRSLSEEEYGITVRGAVIHLSGGSDRAVLYAVYDLLERLGCVWMAPGFTYYAGGQSEYIPHRAELVYLSSGDVYQHPVFRYRKLDVEEGQTHTVENLRQMIEWMAKLRFNVLQVPLNYGGWGKVKWDNWREAVTPELKKRGMLIEVGGHGYQNFLSAAMEDSTLFQKHPDWFGKDKNCQPTPDEYSVFNTANPDAVAYLVGNVVKYLRQHPEIDIFDFWPPDMARWAGCPSLLSLGSPLDRQARLINAVDSAVHRIKPTLRMEMIAYQPVLLPPGTVVLNKDILVDFCPINQSFERQIYDTPVVNNPEYVRALRQWRGAFGGNIGLYSYYRKYGWRSLPNIIPHYMQADLRWYAGIPLQGISSYAEPGDWRTYELNHYILGHLAWNPLVGVDSLVAGWCRVRYGAGWRQAVAVYAALEKTVRAEGSIPYTTLKPVEKIKAAGKELKGMRAEAVRLGPGLSLPLEYAIRDLEIQELRAAAGERSTATADSVQGGPEDPVRDKAGELVQGKVGELVRFLEANRGKGYFVLPAKNAPGIYLKKYAVGARRLSP